MKVDQQAVFVSTQAFGRTSLREALTIAAGAGLTDIELSSGVAYCAEAEHIVREASATLNLLIHNYFPAPERPFVLNLASDDEDVLRLSRHHCRRAIKLSRDVGAPFYSVHAGFCFHATPAHLGVPQTALPRIPQARAADIFADSVLELAMFAEEQGIALAIENNVVTRSNVVDGRNELLLGVTAEQLIEVIRRVDRPNVGLLIDVGHLNVSANALEFDPGAFLAEVGRHVIAIHLSDNDGIRDSNRGVTPASWFWNHVRASVPGSAVWILEVSNIAIDGIAAQVATVRGQLAAQEA